MIFDILEVSSASTEEREATWVAAFAENLWTLDFGIKVTIYCLYISREVEKIKTTKYLIKETAKFGSHNELLELILTDGLK